jgi:hypothetical protein
VTGVPERAHLENRLNAACRSIIQPGCGCVNKFFRKMADNLAYDFAAYMQAAQNEAKAEPSLVKPQVLPD